MGMDVCGINPMLKSPAPAEIDWATSTDDQKSQYVEAVERHKAENPGVYFRANMWSWRPIAVIIDTVNEKLGLGIDTSGFGWNDGHGVKDPELCKVLAACIRQEILESGVMESGTIYLNTGFWTDSEGRFLDSKKQENVSQAGNQPLIMTTGIVTPDGEILYPAHSVDKEHLEEFCNFLDQCGGFEIW